LGGRIFRTRDEAEQQLAMLQNSPPGSRFSYRQLTVRQITSDEQRALSDPCQYDGSGRAIDWSHLARAAPPEEVDKYLSSFDSYRRTKPMCCLMLVSAPRRCLQIFSEWGNMCDAPWPYRTSIAAHLREARAKIHLTEMLGPAERVFYEALTDPIPVWRGCERGRERGLHWTTNRALAEDFAQGKRCINKNPTLVAAEIPKQHVFAVFTSRQEDEVVVDHRRLRKLKAMPIEPQEHRPAFLPYS
jgi:hypothetical protein